MSFGPEGVILAPGEGRVVQVPGHPYVYKATGENTRGAYSLVEVTITGQGAHSISTVLERWYGCDEAG
jgi:hypothetical protein